MLQNIYVNVKRWKRCECEMRKDRNRITSVHTQLCHALVQDLIHDAALVHVRFKVLQVPANMWSDSRWNWSWQCCLWFSNTSSILAPISNFLMWLVRWFVRLFMSFEFLSCCAWDPSQYSLHAWLQDVVYNKDIKLIDDELSSCTAFCYVVLPSVAFLLAVLVIVGCFLIANCKAWRQCQKINESMLSDKKQVPSKTFQKGCKKTSAALRLAHLYEQIESCLACQGYGIKGVSNMPSALSGLKWLKGWRLFVFSGCIFLFCSIVSTCFNLVQGSYPFTCTLTPPRTRHRSEQRHSEPPNQSGDVQRTHFQTATSNTQPVPPKRQICRSCPS